MNQSKLIISTIILIVMTSCSRIETVKAETLFHSQCGSCHIAPSPKDLPKHLWKESVLPEMGARMGIKDPNYNPLSGYSLTEQGEIYKLGIYSVKAQLTDKDWNLLKQYILNLAPEVLGTITFKPIAIGLSQFKVKAVNLDSTSGAFISYLGVDSHLGKVIAADLSGNIFKYDFNTDAVVERENLGSTITSFTEHDSTRFITSVGNLILQK